MRLTIFAALPLFLCVFFSGYGKAQAFCYQRTPPKIDSSNDYLIALADTLVVLRTARDRSKELKKTTSLAEFMAVLKTAGQEYASAILYVTPYTESKNKALAGSAEGFRKILLALGHINDYFLEDFKDRLDGKSEQLSAHEERNAEVMMMGADAWRAEMNAMTLACLALIEFDPATGKQLLALTSQERSAMIKRFEKSFGHLLGGKGEDLPPLENSIVLILSFSRKFLGPVPKFIGFGEPKRARTFTACAKFVLKVCEMDRTKGMNRTNRTEARY